MESSSSSSAGNCTLSCPISVIVSLSSARADKSAVDQIKVQIGDVQEEIKEVKLRIKACEGDEAALERFPHIKKMSDDSREQHLAALLADKTALLAKETALLADKTALLAKETALLAKETALQNEKNILLQTVQGRSFSPLRSHLHLLVL